jgi:hypothetical protein
MPLIAAIGDIAGDDHAIAALVVEQQRVNGLCQGHVDHRAARADARRNLRWHTSSDP